MPSEFTGVSDALRALNKADAFCEDHKDSDPFVEGCDFCG